MTILYNVHIKRLEGSSPNRLFQGNEILKKWGIGWTLYWIFSSIIIFRQIKVPWSQKKNQEYFRNLVRTSYIHHLTNGNPGLQNANDLACSHREWKVIPCSLSAASHKAEPWKGLPTSWCLLAPKEMSTENSRTWQSLWWCWDEPAQGHNEARWNEYNSLTTVGCTFNDNAQE